MNYYKYKMEQAMAAIQAQGEGVWQMQIVSSPKRSPTCFSAPPSANGQAARMLTVLKQAVTDMGKKKPPPLCLLCDHVFCKKPDPVAFVLLFAAVDDPSSSIISPPCNACAVRDQLSQRVAKRPELQGLARRKKTLESDSRQRASVPASEDQPGRKRRRFSKNFTDFRIRPRLRGRIGITGTLAGVLGGPVYAPR